MAKTILVPTDFHVASLNTLKLVLENTQTEQVYVILVYSEYLNTSITDLLFYSPYRIINSRISNEFNEALQILKNRFRGTITDITIKVFHEPNRKMLKRFIETHNVEEIFIPKTYKLKTHKCSFDLVPIIKNTSLPFYEIEWESNHTHSEQEQLIALFTSSNYK
ncbi:MAG: hypothetical protein WAQ28_05425 [Bacteroidia bacterium]|jgi:RecG-like helicase